MKGIIMEETIQDLIKTMDTLNTRNNELVLAVISSDKIAESSKQTYFRILEEFKKTVNECQTILDLYPLVSEDDINYIKQGMAKCCEFVRYVQINSYLEITN
jgi:hypothetical protein